MPGDELIDAAVAIATVALGYWSWRSNRWRQHQAGAAAARVRSRPLRRRLVDAAFVVATLLALAAVALLLIALTAGRGEL